MANRTLQTFFLGAAGLVGGVNNVYGQFGATEIPPRYAPYNEPSLAFPNTGISRQAQDAQRHITFPIVPIEIPRDLKSGAGSVIQDASERDSRSTANPIPAPLIPTHLGEGPIVYSGPELWRDPVTTHANKEIVRLALSWFGREVDLPPIQLRVTPVKEDCWGQALSWIENGTIASAIVEVSGTKENTLSTVSHEINHLVLRAKLGRVIPRWIDEGSALIAETKPQRDRFLFKLVDEYLRPSDGRSFPFAVMLPATDLPSDERLWPFYAQATSTVEFLIERSTELDRDHPQRYFMKFAAEVIKDGCSFEAHRENLHKFYGFNSVGDLQLRWLDWLSDKYVKDRSWRE
jgi:hypothetical protein